MGAKTRKCVMFVIFLKFSDNKVKAKDFMEEHNAWIKQGIENDIFILAGSLQPKAGGCIIAHNIDRTDLEQLIAQDPFVKQKVVFAEIFEVNPSIANEKFSDFLTA